ncbi:hypothetical protein JVU11DRAFT_11247 [Chiua virens]|nr:hypothetical protein JVU11DRAFT_11247 [Chiua virens]
MSESLRDVYVDYGPLILGGLLAFALSGCLNMQFIMYWQIYPDERWTTKSLVILTWFLDLCHSVFVAVAIWDSVLAHYGDLSRLDWISWSVGVRFVSKHPPTITHKVHQLAVGLTAMMTFLTQSFFAYRIYRLQNHKGIVAGPVFVLAFIRMVAATVSMVEMIVLQSYISFAQTFPSCIFTLGLALSAFVDVVITTFLCYFLRSNRSRVHSTNRIMDTLTFWTVQNGSITCFAAIASLVCWTVMPENRIFLGLHFIMGKLYANSLLATLNTRSKIRNSWGRNSRSPAQPVSPGVAFRDGDEQAGPGSPRPYHPQVRLDWFKLEPVNLKRSRSIEVSVHRTVESKYDNEVDVDVLSVTVESIHEEEEPRVI